MFENFSGRARKVMAFAKQEAQRFNHEYIGAEHILAAIAREGSGVAATILKNRGIDLRALRLEIEKLVRVGPDMVTIGQLPQSGRAKKVIQGAIEESMRAGHTYVGTEHLLLGLLRETDGVAAQVLKNLALTLDNTRGEMAFLLLGGRPPIPLEERIQERDHRVNTCEVFLTVLNAHEGMIRQALLNRGLNPADIEDVVRSLIAELTQAGADGEPPKGGTPSDSA